MLDLEYIKANTLWALKLENGARLTQLTTKELDHMYESKNNQIDESWPMDWKYQQNDLQEFWKAYDYMYRNMYDPKWYLIDDFYAEWVKNPKKFTAEFRPVIGKLSDTLANMDPCGNLIINNYDGHTAGNHHVGNFVEALQILDTDFDVVSVDIQDSRKEYTYNTIIIQTDDDNMFRSFDAKANQNAIDHDRYFGDGKYYKED